ncbi:hypothetical protein GCM10020367_33880 [Streptomyces sannanensis]|uniref:CopG family transcriptional regulator n=1 Tax=Streptomyces sannanensis TaxID=285536 RepID=A0ABP6SCN9_9ACTN
MFGRHCPGWLGTLGKYVKPGASTRCSVSVSPRPDAEIPALTARMARASNPRGTTAMWVRDQLDGL